MKTLAIIGAGELGRQIAHLALSDKHYEAIVFIDDFQTAKSINGIPVIGRVVDVEGLYRSKAFDALIIGIGYKHLNVKQELYAQFKDIIPFGTIIHSSCWVDKTATIAPGCVLYPSSVIDARVNIKANTLINLHCTISHDSTIGAHCFLAPRVAVAGFVTIDQTSNIGINATIIDGISLASKTQIGAGAVVINSIEKAGLFVGNPARNVRYF